MGILGLNIAILVRTMFDTWHDLASCGVIGSKLFQTRIYQLSLQRKIPLHEAWI